MKVLIFHWLLLLLFQLASLPSMQKLYRDVTEWARQRNFTQRATIKSFDIIEAVCGTRRRPGDKKNKNIPIPVFPFPPKPSNHTSGTNHTKKKDKKYPDHGGKITYPYFQGFPSWGDPPTSRKKSPTHKIPKILSFLCSFWQFFEILSFSRDLRRFLPICPPFYCLRRII